MSNKIAKFLEGERRLLRRERLVETETASYFLLPGTVVELNSYREEVCSGSDRIVYAVTASVTDVGTGRVEDVKFEMTQRELQRHTREEDIHDEFPNRTHEESAVRQSSGE